MPIKMMKSGVAILFLLSMAFGFSWTADAAVVYTDVDPDLVLQGWNGSWSTTLQYPIDIDGDAISDVTLAQEYPYYSSGAWFWQSQSTEYAFGYEKTDWGINFAKAFEAGDEIGSNESWMSEALYLEWVDYYEFGFEGEWMAMEGYTAYAGVHFYSSIDDDWHYGWLKLKVDNENGSEVTLYGYAWETDPNTPIIAGDTGSPVPVPGAVWLLGSGVVGFMGIRRKYNKR